MKFIDHTLIQVQGGKGGDGIVSFRSAKGRPKMGPDGGDGGAGGSVYLVADEGLNTLAALRYKQEYKAENGARGGSNDRTGRRGEDRRIPIPPGTVVYDDESGERLGEVVAAEDALKVAEGGERGLGNSHWVTATRQAPGDASEGRPGESRTLRLELKLLANVGLAGFPNAGKSTLLSRLSRAKPKVADYPFTTLTPQLGVVEPETEDPWKDDSFVVADIPGLIEGASEGRGLGHDFLKHLERTQVIAYVLDLYDPERTPQQAFDQLRTEVAAFGAGLENKLSVVVLSKADLVSEEEMQRAAEPFEGEGYRVCRVSAVSGYGIAELKRVLRDRVSEARKLAAEESSIPGNETTP